MRIVIAGPDKTVTGDVGAKLGELLGLESRSLIGGSQRDSSADTDWCVLSVHDSAMLDLEVRRRLRKGSILFLLFDSEVSTTYEALCPFADFAIDASDRSADDLAASVHLMVEEELSVRLQSPNTFGEIIRVTTFGESHGDAIGAVLDGVRAGIELREGDIQRELDRRRPGQSAVTTARKEKDRIHILSGVFEGKTTGAPVAMIIYNHDRDSSSYEALRDVFRPGHADFTFYRKYGHRDYRGGGRSSGRETAARVACGAVALKMLGDRGVRVVAHAVEIARIKAETFDLDTVESNSVRCGDPKAAERMEAAVLEAKKDSDSVGGIVQLEAHGVPAGLGDPVFYKLDARLTHAIMSIGAVKGVEIGLGFDLARLRGSQSNDAMSDGRFLSNNAGGITGGISTGQPIIVRAAVKPTSSIGKTQKTMDVNGSNRRIEIRGRHDPCIVPRVIPVIESMAALVILDAWEVQSRLRPDWEAT